MLHGNKDAPNQNFIEIYVNKKNVNELSQDEALARYKKNTYILGRIFSNFAEIEEEDEGFPEETQKNEVFQHLTEEKLSAMRKELEDLEGKSQKRLDIYQKRNKKFKELLSEGKHLKNEAQFQEFKAKLIEENLYAGDHPFFCEDSPFYLSTDDGFLKEVPKQLGGFDGAMDNFIVFQL